MVSNKQMELEHQSPTDIMQSLHLRHYHTHFFTLSLSHFSDCKRTKINFFTLFFLFYLSFWKIHSQKHERRDTHEPNECKFNEQLNCELTSKEKLRSCCMCSATQCFQRMFSMIMSVVIKWNICDFCDNCRDWDNKRFTVRNYLITICLRIYHNYIKVRKFWQKIKSLEEGSNPNFFFIF